MQRRFPFHHLLLAVTLLTSCAPKTTAIPSVPAPTNSLPLATSSPEMEHPLLQAGFNYDDAVDDTSLSFLDVTHFQATVDEETDTVEAIFTVRDIPPSVERGRVRNVAEYQWELSVYLHPADRSSGEPPADYSFYAWSFTLDPTTGVNQTDETNRTATSEPTVVPIDQLWTSTSINDQSNESIGPLVVTANPESDTLTMRGVLPGITSTAGFRYSTKPYDGIGDQPDDFNPDGAANPLTVVEPATQAPSARVDSDTHLISAGAVRAYPGPAHYAGDILTFEILTDNAGVQAATQAKLTLDKQEPFEVSGQWLFDRLVLPMALDTTNLSGRHTLNFSTTDGSLNETYSFEVLPASQRPDHEENASWIVNEIDCCMLHYISGTAAARDIDFIAEHFQQAADDITSTTGKQIDPKLDVYVIDRIWGNGGFGGDGEIVVSYTDRYYGPTIGAEGLETLGRHEFTHATGIGMEQAGDGVLFNAEGLAVYVAGGHYKPEPLAARGAALYDLGYYVPVGQFIRQHELSYLYAAAMLAYIVERYGSDTLWEFLAADADKQDGQPTELETAVRLALGIPLKQFDQDFQAWLESKDPGEQLDDLRLTIELQDLRRNYQETYSPPPYFIFGKAEAAAARPEYLPVLIREADAPANAAAELIIADAQQAIVDREYDRAEQLNRILQKVINTGNFEDALAKDYLEIASMLVNAGYTVLSLDLQGNRAIAQVTQEPPAVTSLELEKVDGMWRVKP